MVNQREEYTEPLLPLADSGEATPDDTGDLPILKVSTLDVLHPGVTAAIARYYGEAAAVCVARHHANNPVRWSVRVDQTVAAYALEWPTLTDAARRGFANRDDATRDAAYGVALASAQGHLGLVALRRAEGLTGADYYLVPVDSQIDAAELDLDREDIVRLEVSGIDSDTEVKLRGRLTAKIKQAHEGTSSFPALAVVVGFRSGTTLFASPVAA